MLVWWGNMYAWNSSIARCISTQLELEATPPCSLLPPLPLLPLLPLPLLALLPPLLLLLLPLLPLLPPMLPLFPCCSFGWAAVMRLTAERARTFAVDMMRPHSPAPNRRG